MAENHHDDHPEEELPQDEPRPRDDAERSGGDVAGAGGDAPHSPDIQETTSGVALPEDVPPELVERIVQVAYGWSGPMPDPNTLGQYEDVHPGGAERIFGITEEQIHHRQYLERITVESGVARERHGQWMRLRSPSLP